jgi:hypothetical protein
LCLLILFQSIVPLLKLEILIHIKSINHYSKLLTNLLIDIFFPLHSSLSLEHSFSFPHLQTVERHAHVSRVGFTDDFMFRYVYQGEEYVLVVVSADELREACCLVCFAVLASSQVPG